ncbi:hypothetical protein JCM11491_004057 [Sporobolomyces phaffii]
MARRRYDERSDASSDATSSSDDNHRPPSRRRGSGRRVAYTARQDEPSSSSTVTTSSDESASDSEDDRKRLTTRQRRSTSTRSPPLTCFLGVALALGLVAIGGYAIWIWTSSSSSASSSDDADTNPKTVTVTTGADSPKTSVTSTRGETTAASSTSSPASSGSSKSSESKSSSGDSSSPIVLSGLARNNIGIGFLPDYTNQNMKKITEGLGVKSSFYGWYAQLPESEPWDGAQLLYQMDDIKACNCIFQPAVMLTRGWKGLTKDDNFQALAIAKVMKIFTDEGIDVQLRFAHEINWYQEDGTYKGDANDFKEGWSVVAAAVADNPKVRMFFTPNIAGALEDYVAFMPEDLSTVHLLGLVSFPRLLTSVPGFEYSSYNSSFFQYCKSTESFVDRMKPLYDKYCSDGKILFAIGETGNGWVGPIEERLTWLDQCTSEETAKAMPHYVGVSWFNYDKEREFRLFIEGDSKVNEASKKWLADASGITQEGATAGNA